MNHEYNKIDNNLTANRIVTDAKYISRYFSQSVIFPCSTYTTPCSLKIAVKRIYLTSYI